VDVPAAGNRPARKVYCLDQAELDSVLETLRRDGVREGRWSVSRFKGLGEMSAEQLWDPTMNPDTRRLPPFTYGQSGQHATVSMFGMLMGKGESGQRRQWLEQKGNLADVDV